MNFTRMAEKKPHEGHQFAEALAKALFDDDPEAESFEEDPRFKNLEETSSGSLRNPKPQTPANKGSGSS